MSTLEKKEYKISVWDEEQYYLVSPDGKYENAFESRYIPEKHTVLNRYTKEINLATIGSNAMDTPIRAFNPKLVRQTNGTNTLTFQLFYRYYDEEENVFHQNPFINLLTNERKVKLFYDGKWYEFVVKQIQEDSRNQTFVYTCQDLYISELSKNGYSLVFDTELENNMGTVTELGDVIVDGTSWCIDHDKSVTLIQKNEEALYTYRTEEALTATIIGEEKYASGEKEKGDQVTIPVGSVIYIGYSSYNNWEKGEEIQFFYRSNTDYEVDDDWVLTNSAVYTAVPSFEEKPSLSITSDYRGKCLVSSRRPKFIPSIEKYCYEYEKEGEEYYAFIGSEFLSFDKAENLITNPSGFTSTDGWSQAGGTLTIEDNCLSVNFSNGDLCNSGLYDSKVLLQENRGFVKGARYILAIKTSGNVSGGTISYIDSKGIAKNITTPGEFSNSKLVGYEAFYLLVDESVSYSDIVNGDLKFFISGSGAAIIEDVKLFKEVYVDGNLLVADMESEIYDLAIQDKYYFFEKSKLEGITSIDDITFDCVLLKSQIQKEGFELLGEESYEKITSITASKSNRFNLIQKVCEAFECWARFEIEHDELGVIKTEYFKTEDTEPVEGKRYYAKIGEGDTHKDYIYATEVKGSYERRESKKIVFKEYIGKDNYAGFKYGINLNSISRNIDSKQITTKLIVEPNSNEFGEDGFCTIQRATMNPIGENIIYNFQYFLNNGLISKEELHTDLYDTENGIGLYVNLRLWNAQNAPLIKQQSEVSITLAKAISKLQIYNSIYTEAENKYKAYVADLRAAGVSSPETVTANTSTYSDAINKLIEQRDVVKTTKTHYAPLKANMQSLVDKYEEKYKKITEDLKQASKRTENIKNEFFKKYSRFVQEGTWISEEYYDDDLYFLAAQKVGKTSAFPQITYNISVLELSGLEEYQNYKFEIGDKTYIEDVEFFGYDQQTGRPYQEEIIVSEIQNNLDDPSNDTIKVQNYKTRFEDLFSRVAAATQSLQYHEGKYDKTSSVVNEDKTISASVLEKTLKFNYCLADAVSKEISAGGKNIDMTAATNLSRRVRLTGLGIELSDDAGRTWRTAISADGINADVGVFGSLHTNSLRIYNGDDENFYWDANGITAYAINDGKPLYNQFVRFSKFGVYGYIGSMAEHYIPESINDIEDDAVFSLTWKGLALNSLKNGSYVRLSTSGVEEGEKTKIIWAGTKVDGEDSDNFAIYQDGSVYFKGNGEFTGTIKAGGGDIGGWTIDKDKGLFKGDLGLYSTPQTISEKNNIVFCAGSNFYVDSDGYLTATGATFSGTLTSASGYFSGELSAASGTFKGELIAETINTLGTFKVLDRVTEGNTITETTYGFIGKAQGSKPNPVEGQPSITTYGVCLTQGNPVGGYLDATNKGAGAGQYVVVTDGGVRLQAGANSITVTESGAFYNKNGDSKEIGSGSGTAVFG